MPAPGHVLVVDDEVAMLAMTQVLLKRMGYRVTVSASGEEALRVFQHQQQAAEGRFCLVLLDLAMPGGLSGMEVLGWMRRIDPGIKVIATSGYLEPNSRPAARDAGFAGILPKPYTADRLAAEMQWVLAH